MSQNAWTLCLNPEKPPGLETPKGNRFQELSENDHDEVKEMKFQRDLDLMEMESNYESEFPKKQMGNYSKGQAKGPKMPRAKFDKGMKKEYVPKVLQEIPLHLFYPEPARQGLHPCIADRAKDGWEVIKGVMDSGASESVTCPSTCPDYEAVPSRMSKAGLNYVSASGDPIPNLGEKMIQVMTGNGKESTAKYQVADVSRTLNSVSEICDGGGDMGQYVLFNKWGGAILNPATGRQTPFQREDGIYILEMWVKPRGSDSVFPRPGK